MARRVLVTGAFGNVGRRTVEHLLRNGCVVVATDLRNPRTEPIAASLAGQVEVRWADITDAAAWSTLLDGVETVVHLAAIIPPLSECNKPLATSVNVTATAALVRAMESSVTAHRLILASSMAIGGFEQHLRQPPMTADAEPSPSDHYGTTKVECEAIVRESRLDWSILRITACPPVELSASDAESLVNMFSATPDSRVEVVHHDDAALAFANCVACDEAIGKILYVGGGASCREFALNFYNRILGAMGLGPIRPELLRRGPTHFFGDWVDTDESQRLLQFQRHGLEDICNEIRRNLGWRRIALRMFAPIINSVIARRSPNLRSADQPA